LRRSCFEFGGQAIFKAAAGGRIPVLAVEFGVANWQ